MSRRTQGLKLRQRRRYEKMRERERLAKIEDRPKVVSNPLLSRPHFSVGKYFTSPRITHDAIIKMYRRFPQFKEENNGETH